MPDHMRFKRQRKYKEDNRKRQISCLWIVRASCSPECNECYEGHYFRQRPPIKCSFPMPEPGMGAYDVVRRAGKAGILSLKFRNKEIDKLSQVQSTIR